MRYLFNGHFPSLRAELFCLASVPLSNTIDFPVSLSPHGKGSGFTLWFKGLFDIRGFPSHEMLDYNEIINSVFVISRSY
ncbi:hypothetical protein G4B88_016165 [Cannabis sativa]|uniref:Uncharacterized protein n=1 Tax=Cannabis sativa TaxID=3483 RepID=A0A7J6FH23_CANSA|nr:hypothetical protein G4B88_016165 [Cannabis sativa]